MANISKQNQPDSVKSSALETLSIKKLTLLGFSLVALPLVIALLYSAAQMNQLSNESKDAIFNAAALTETNRSLSETLVKMERNASQSIVLKDPELLSNYFVEEKNIINIVNDKLRKNTDTSLRDTIEKFLDEVNQIHEMLSNTNQETLYLSKIQDQFKELAKTSQIINDKSNQLIFTQAVDVRTSARLVRQTMLKSLLIIPLTILIAIFFIIRITKPLKKLIKHIQVLEKGNFEHAINFRSSPEINEIIDALEVMRTRLHALELQKSSFIRHVSHEVKTPLAAIREGTELMYDNIAGPLNKDQQEIIDITRDGSTRLQQLIEDLLDFNIVLDSTSLQDSEKLDVPFIINEVLLERKLDLKRKNINVDLKCDSIFIYSNGKQLAVILDNLISNAIKYSPNNGTIAITASLQAEHLLLSLSDEGKGIEENMLEHMFEAFVKGPSPEGYPIKSSGLGLTIVKELLMRINGTIDVETSTKSPSGTRFELTLPRAFKKGKIMNKLHLKPYFIACVLFILIGCQTTQAPPPRIPTYGDYYLWIKTLTNDELLQEVDHQRQKQEDFSSDADIHIMLLHSLPESPIYNPYEAKSILNELQLQYLQSRYNPTNLAFITMLRDLLNEQLLTIQKQNDITVQYKNDKKILARVKQQVSERDKELLQNSKTIFELDKQVQILKEQLSQLQSIEKNISEHGK